ncbi:universal stress protein [Alkalihalophilus marmarensis]|uniref:universal stress protein n=1 Tax=Alkalihalophilus marmarensis TaxID=521377 RepID=UPI00203C2154|nr:universal stress protein [Alkalihalophilus marmarensis]MCM3490992.1 universal stress protein [Alkalihalophilus marmarensis]
MYKKVLAAVDGSDHSLRAIEQAVKITSKKEGFIDLIYVISGETSKSDVLKNKSKMEIEQNRKAMLTRYEEKLASHNIQYETYIRNGEPGPTIVEFANENDYDVVVLGSRGLNKLQSMVLGSVSHKVAKRVSAPVLIVK